jgi:hypothetical protein
MALHERRDVDAGLEPLDLAGVTGVDGRLRSELSHEHLVADLQRANAELLDAKARLERANRELWRENARLARGRLGRSDGAAGAYLMRAENARAEAARLEILLSTPRHQAVERLRDVAMRSPFLYTIVRRLWSWLARP